MEATLVFSLKDREVKLEVPIYSAKSPALSLK